MYTGCLQELFNVFQFPKRTLGYTTLGCTRHPCRMHCSNISGARGSFLNSLYI